jgi:hypothetical protein
MNTPSNVGTIPSVANLNWGAVVEVTDAPGGLFAGSAFGLAQVGLAGVDGRESLYLLGGGGVLSSFAWRCQNFNSPGDQATFALYVEGVNVRTLIAVSVAGEKLGTVDFRPVIVSPGQRVSLAYVGDAADVDAKETVASVM